MTKDVAKFASEIGSMELPAKAVEIACAGFADCVAVIYAGWEEPAVAALLNRRGNQVSGMRPFAASLAPADQVALVHAAAAHVHDWDDTALSGHPSAVLVPAILAEAAARPTTGRCLISAYLAGYEVWANLILRDPAPLHGSGWHPSATIGVPAATAAIATMRGFDQKAATNALSLAASMSGGVIANFGTMAKSWQLARAAEAGIVAADLVEAGLTAAPDALEHRSGLLAALSRSDKVDLTSPSSFGREWAILTHGLNLKMYPVCYAMHRLIDAAVAIHTVHHPAIDKIQKVTLELGDTQAGMLRNHAPTDPLDAKFSAEFGVAAALITGRCSRAELRPDFIGRSDVQDLISRIALQTTSERMPGEPAHSPWDRVTVRLRDGRILQSEKTAFPCGHFRNPAPDNALRAKFDDAVGQYLTEPQADAIFTQLITLATLPSTVTLFDALTSKDLHATS